MTDYVTPPGTEAGVFDELDPHIFEGVAYYPLRLHFLSPSHSEDYPVVCLDCDWERTVGDLPRDGQAYVQPPYCPDCAKQGDLGRVRTHVTDAKAEVPDDA